MHQDAWKTEESTKYRIAAGDTERAMSARHHNRPAYGYPARTAIYTGTGQKPLTEEHFHNQVIFSIMIKTEVSGHDQRKS